jgi:alcohol dehydrogenase class IV
VSGVRIVFGAGSLCRLPALLQQGAKLALITGRQAARASGLLAQVVGLVDGKTNLVLTLAVPSHPAWEDYLCAARSLRGSGANLVLALGGGSVMDVAKYAASADGEALDLVGVPTLFGSGAEVTPFATVWDRTAMRKRSVTVRPCGRVLVDPLLVLPAAKAVRATSALDALAHGADVLWQVGGSGCDRARAAAAIRLVRRWLAEALAGKTVALCRMAAASILGGLAIASAGSGASHALSYPLQLRFSVPHGLGCALALLWLMRALPEQVPIQLLGALGAIDPPSGARQLERLIVCAGFSPRLPSQGISVENLGLIAAEADPARLARAGIEIASETLAKLLCEVA